MRSFRRDQFRAMLQAIVIADALSHGHLTCETGVALAAIDAASPSASVVPLASALVSDRGCRYLTTTFKQLTEPDRINGNDAASVHHAELLNGPDATLSSAQNVVEAILMRVPWGLLNSGHLLSAADAVLDPQETAVASFYEAIAALLAGDLAQVRAIHCNLQQANSANVADAEPDNIEPYTAALVTLALDHVLEADGNALLAIARSLQVGDRQAGLPILTGMLSAAWSGATGLSLLWCQALISPEPSLQQWLQSRWQISTGETLNQWAEALWHRWSGRYGSRSGLAQVNLHPALHSIC